MKRKLKFDGSWYPSQKKELEQLVKVTPSNDNKDLFGVVPHAGLYYSSSLIKLFFNNLNPSVDKILLITPSHYYALEDDIVGSGNIDSYECIINDIPGYNIASIQKGYEKVTEAEHAVEMILPFIAQRVNMSLCCAHVNRFTDVNIATKYAKELLSEIDDTSAVLASSDFTHYGSDFGYTPFGRKVDKSVVEKVSSYDKDIANRFAKGDASDAYIQATENDKATICGIAPMLLVSEMARLKNMTGRILGQSNSIRDFSPDNNFVSYLSIAWR
jgi:AmmeMemoRadiSam system protein B